MSDPAAKDRRRGGPGLAVAAAAYGLWLVFLLVLGVIQKMGG